jgi:uncharacterized protein YacL (UPF0231 family)
MKKVFGVSAMQFLVGLMCLTCVLAAQAYADDRDTTTKVSGVISKIHAGRISVTTSWGRMSIQSDALAKAKVGDEITVWVNESNVVIDAYPQGAARPQHRWIRGTLAYTSVEQDAIRLWTPEGVKEFGVKINRPKFTMFPAGAPITVQLNDQDEVIDVHPALELALELIPVPYTEPGQRMQVDGVVAEIRSGQVFVKTSVGQYSLNAKTAPQDVEVGDKLTLWVSGNNVAVDHHARGKEGVHRFITGKLTYASDDKKEIKLMTQEGERSFPVQHGESKLSGMLEGTLITVELNEAGRVIEIRKMG